MASRCVRAWVPEPMMATSPASSRASIRVASPLTAAVRMAVTSVASRMASRRPFVVSNRSTTPWCESKGVCEFPANTLITFMAMTPAGGNIDGMDASRPDRSGSDVKERSGMIASPLASAASASPTAWMHSPMGRRRRTSS